ncbi:MAG TPA: xylulokinase [Casimicrobiaceae bacterium]|nr:xylulokinase [Casimicrobiaceae bacterium]
MFLGIDLGTSSVKALMVDEQGAVTHEAAAPLEVARPHPQWCEQQPHDWWTATVVAVRALPAAARSAVRGIGLAGQMHGAVLLDAHDAILRPAILWNDGRSAAACSIFEQRAPRSRAISGNLAMPGFTAPKLIWVADHEPATFARIARVLLPKDWLRLVLTGEHASEPSDAAGTLWLDLESRRWSTELVAASGLTLDAMPHLVASNAISGRLARDAAEALGLAAGTPVAGGGSDNACGAAGVGIADEGDALLSLGTSGVIFVADDVPRPDPANAIHAFCHCLDARWHRMAVMLACTSTLALAARITGLGDETALVAEAERASPRRSQRLVMLPYLDGERTPHNDATACGVLFGLDSASTRADVARAALEGVAFALADGLGALEVSGPRIGALAVIGGGARSPVWGRIIAAALRRTLLYPRHGEYGPALGAARLARMAVDHVDAAVALTKPPLARTIEPHAALADELEGRRSVFRALYRDLAPRFAATAPTAATA